jgi:hypothetical protein
VAGTCEYAKEPSGSIKCGELISWLAAKTGQLLKKDSAPWSKSVSNVLKVRLSFAECPRTLSSAFRPYSW